MNLIHGQNEVQEDRRKELGNTERNCVLDHQVYWAQIGDENAFCHFCVYGDHCGCSDGYYECENGLNGLCSSECQAGVESHVGSTETECVANNPVDCTHNG